MRIIFAFICFFLLGCDNTDNMDLNGQWLDTTSYTTSAGEEIAVRTISKIYHSNDRLVIDTCDRDKVYAYLEGADIMWGQRKIGLVVDQSKIELWSDTVLIPYEKDAFTSGNLNIQRPESNINIDTSFEVCALYQPQPRNISGNLEYVDSVSINAPVGLLGNEKISLVIAMPNMRAGSFVIPDPMNQIQVSGKVSPHYFNLTGTLVIDEYTGDRLRGSFSASNINFYGSFDVNVALSPNTIQ